MVLPTDYQAQVELQTSSGIPADNVINTFALQWGGGGTPDETDWVAVAAALSTFYTSWQSYRSTTVPAGGAHHVKAYRLSDPSPRVPVATVPVSIGGGTASSRFPSEVACCLSYTSFVESGDHPARRRGRIFLGPLAGSSSSTGADGFVRPSAGFQTDIGEAGAQLALDVLATGFTWCVWSRTDDELFPVIGGWVENEFDTQRRRGPAGTSRTPWAVGG